MRVNEIKENLKYQVIKRDGKYYTRVICVGGASWNEGITAFDTLDEAIEVLKKKKEHSDGLIDSLLDEAVFELED